MSSPSNITAPFLNLQDAAGNTGTVPLLYLLAGLGSNTIGVEITSQSVSSSGVTLPNLHAIMGAGFGGLSLVQTGQPPSAAAGQSSPFLTMCAQQWGTNVVFPLTDGPGPACWNWQVQGTTMVDGPDILKLTRTPTTNKTFDVTVLFPPSINLSTAANFGGSAGQITVGPAPITGPNANVPSTLTGATTSDTTSSAAAGPVTVQPGQLSAAAGMIDPAAAEGALQILQSYMGTNNSGMNQGRLACIGAAQNVVPCTTVGQAENWVGVYNAIMGQAGGTVTPLRYGRVLVADKNVGTSNWSPNHFVCKDDSNASYVIENGSTTPCPLGESVGITVGEIGSSHLHLVDLIPAASTTGGAMLSFFCTGGVSSNATIFVFPSSSNTACLAIGAAMEQPVSLTGILKNLVVSYSSAPGAGKTDTFTVLKCASLGACTPTPLLCSIMNSSTSCTDFADTVSVSQGDGIEIKDVTNTASGGASARISIQIQ